MSEQVTAYKCGYCGSLHSTEEACQQHENGCVYNPNTWEGKSWVPKNTRIQPDIIYRRFPETRKGEDE